MCLKKKIMLNIVKCYSETQQDKNFKKIIAFSDMEVTRDLDERYFGEMVGVQVRLEYWLVMSRWEIGNSQTCTTFLTSLL